MKKNENKNNKYKELYLKLKEDWKDPRKKAGIKLLGYLFFFLIFAIMVRVSSYINVNDNKNNTLKENVVTTESIESYREKQKSLLENNHTINYDITINDINYKINGTIKDNIVEGYLEEVSGIKKIVIKDNVLYEIKDGIEVILDLSIVMNKLNLKYLMSIVEQNQAYIDNSEDIKSYQYAININDLENIVIVYTNDKSIYKITISDSISNYVLTFDN